MFKIKCYESGLREIYFGKKKIFKIRNLVQGLRFMLNNISKKIDVLVLDMVESQQSKEGIYHFQYLLRRAHIAGKYYEIFYEFYLQNQNGKKVVLSIVELMRGYLVMWLWLVEGFAMLLSLINIFMLF